MSFADELAGPLPRGMTLAPEIVAAVDWMESTGYVESGRRGRFATLFAPWERPNDQWWRGSLLAPMASDWARHWLDSTNEGRVGHFVQTGVDGSQAGIWLDDKGHEQYVHFGSGSGSLWFGVIADNPIDFLRFLALGYAPDACWIDNLWLTPYRAWEGQEGARSYIRPTALQEWISTTFDVTIPATAAEIIPYLPAHEFEENPGDPFTKWVNTIADDKQ